MLEYGVSLDINSPYTGQDKGCNTRWSICLQYIDLIVLHSASCNTPNLYFLVLYEFNCNTH